METGSAATLGIVDSLKNCMFAVPAQYRRQGVWVFNSATLLTISKFKDGNNRYLFEMEDRYGGGIGSSEQAVGDGRLLGKPFYISEQFPSEAANAYIAVFGDLTGYKAPERVGMSIARLDELYAETNAVAFVLRVRVGGQDLNESIASGVRKKYGVQVGHQTIEQIKTTLGNAFPVEKDEAREVYGKDVMDGLPKAVFVSNWEIREMLLSPIERIVSSVKAVLERIPPELSEDVKKYGITLSGGTAMLRGMNKLVENVTGVECTVPRRSALACLAGAEKVVGDLKRHRRFLCSRHGRSLT